MQRYNDYFGSFGGRYVAEMLRTPLDELQEAFLAAMESEDYLSELAEVLRDFAGRPTPLLFARNATRALGGARIYIKCEGLAHTGAHKINNAVGQALLARRMGKTRIIAETGAGQHGVATAAVCAKLGIPCRVYMGEVDMRRQRPNVFWMERYGAEVAPVRSGSATLKDAVNEALRDWAASFPATHYLLGSALGPSPYPDMVREFQSVIGRELVSQMAEKQIDCAALVACVGGGSNAIGIFSPFIEKQGPDLIGVEAGGRGAGAGEHASRMNGRGRPGIVQGYKSLFLSDEDGQLLPTHSISAGLDYPGIGPQLAHLGETGRIRFTTASDSEALEAVEFFARTEGMVFALESAHAAAAVMKIARTYPPEKAIVVNMSGRGDKDLFILAGALDSENWHAFLASESAPGNGDAAGNGGARDGSARDGSAPVPAAGSATKAGSR
ncbi:MAG: tryptophan synthase subunit beta [Spirochaetia bacterium]|jgi:tryptophan synthase beta chain